MRAREAAGQRVAIRAVTALAGAGDGLNDATLQINAADGVAFRIGDVEAAIGRIGDAFGPGEFRHSGRAAVARVTSLARAGDMVNALAMRVCARINAVDGVPFAEYHVEVTLGIDGE